METWTETWGRKPGDRPGVSWPLLKGVWPIDPSLSFGGDDESISFVDEPWEEASVGRRAAPFGFEGCGF